MKVNRNISAVLVNEQLLRNENGLSESLERLSSGFKFNHAKDNPSGVAISYKMQAQINALDRASANTTDGLSIVQTIDGSIGEMNEVAQRIRELCVQAANDTNTQEDREAIQLEVNQLKQEFDRISRDTEFNGKKLLDGSLDRRVYVTNEDKTKSYFSEISNVIISDGVETGDYLIQVTKVATKTADTYEGGSLWADPDPNAKITKEQAGTIKINSSTINIEEGMSKDEVLDTIRDAAEIENLELSSGDVQQQDDSGNVVTDTNGDPILTHQMSFIHQKAGAYTFEISCSSETLQNAVLGTWILNKSLQGTNAIVELPTPAADSTLEKFSSEATTLTDGNNVVIRDRSGFEMSFEINITEDVVGIDGELGTPRDFYIEATNIGTLQLQVGANEDNEIDVRVATLNTTSLHIKDLDVSKMGGATEGISMMDKAISQISAARSKMGSYENSLEFAQKSLDANNENMTSAISRLEDTDMAKEMTRYTSYNVLDQASISILAQANDMPKQILSLLQF